MAGWWVAIQPGNAKACPEFFADFFRSKVSVAIFCSLFFLSSRLFDQLIFRILCYEDGEKNLVAAKKCRRRFVVTFFWLSQNYMFWLR